MKMQIKNLLGIIVMVLSVLAVASCSSKKFHIKGNITDAKDSVLYLENMSLNGPVAIDSVVLTEDGAFSFEGDAPDAPDFYRLRIAGQIINVAVDSTEVIDIKASYPTMATRYEVKGSDDCDKIRELTLLQMGLQAHINSVIATPELNMQQVKDSVERVIEAYKYNVKNEYIFKEPMKAYSYFALFQTVVFGNVQTLIFNPQTSEDDVKVFAAVATSWDTFYPESERGLNLHNIAIEGMKNVRILRAAQSQTIDPSKVNMSGIIDVVLPDNKGNTRRLTELAGKVVLLDFHVYAQDGSTERIMMLRELYNKYHERGFEIFQVSLDPDEHFWKTSTAALPWICVRDENGSESPYLSRYNILALPTFFLIDRQNNLYKRDAQMQDVEAEIKNLL